MSLVPTWLSNKGWELEGQVSFSCFSTSSQLWHPTSKTSVTASLISRWVPLAPAAGNLQQLSPNPSSWCLCSVQAFWALKPHFMEVVSHPGLLWHSTNPVHSDLIAEKKSLSCPRSPKLPAAWEPPSTTCSHVASQRPCFLALCGLDSCFCKTMKTLFIISWSPSTVLLSQTPYMAAQCPRTLCFPGAGRGEGWGHLLFAGMLSPAPASDPEPANSGGKSEVLNGPGLLVEEGKEMKRIAADSAWHSVLLESHRGRRMQRSSPAKGDWRDL